jgi:hypothetical protein
MAKQREEEIDRGKVLKKTNFVFRCIMKIKIKKGVLTVR